MPVAASILSAVLCCDQRLMPSVSVLWTCYYLHITMGDGYTVQFRVVSP